MAKARLQILYTGCPYEVLSLGRQTFFQMGTFVVTWPIFTTRRYASTILAVVMCLSICLPDCKRHFPLRSQKNFLEGALKSL